MYINTYITSDASSLYFFTWDACYFTCFICDFMITSGTLARTNQDWPVRPIAVPAQRITCPPLLCQHAGIPSVHEIPGPQVGRHCRFLRVDENVSSMSESNWYDLRKQVEFWWVSQNTDSGVQYSTVLYWSENHILPGYVNIYSLHTLCLYFAHFAFLLPF